MTETKAGLRHTLARGLHVLQRFVLDGAAAREVALLPRPRRLVAAGLRNNKMNTTETDKTEKQRQRIEAFR